MANPVGLSAHLQHRALANLKLQSTGRIQFFSMALASAATLFCGSVRAQETVATFDPANTKIEFTLPATLHTVHGTFRLRSGEVRFNATTGDASGEVVIDATTGSSENPDRDKKMHKEVLESDKYLEITFVPSHVNGSVPTQGTSTVEVAGVIRLHGQDHPMTLPVTVTRSASGDLEGEARFAIPYAKWGLKNPSTFILRVSETVDVDIHATIHVN